MNILIINGPNLNLLGKREPAIYGNSSFTEYLEDLRKQFPDEHIDYFQSNYEGDIVERLHKADDIYDGIILNAAAYTHTSVAIADAISGISVPVVEVHISNIFKRESFRHKSYIAPYCKGSISGFGLDSYRLALLGFKNNSY